MRAMRRWTFGAPLAMTAAVGCLIGVFSRAAGEEPAVQERREPFTLPLTPEEGRWLLDTDEGRQHLQFRGERREPGVLVPSGPMPEFLQSIQQGLGGPLIDRFESLEPLGARPTPWWEQFEGSLETPTTRPATGAEHPGAAVAPPGMWPNWTAQSAGGSVVQANAEVTDLDPPPARLAALRTTAAELDGSANRLEALELYRQADALRELAQRLRIDARRDTTGGETAAGIGPVPPADGPPRDPWAVEVSPWGSPGGYRPARGSDGARRRRPRGLVPDLAPSPRSAPEGEAPPPREGDAGRPDSAGE